MKTILIAAAALVIGAIIGTMRCAATIRGLRRQLREALAGNAQKKMLTGKHPASIFQSITRFLFVTAQIFAIVWISWSYVIATYSTIVLLQPFPAEELSKEAVRTILGVGVLKVVENIFEHNEGAVFGKSKEPVEPTAEGADDDHERNDL